MILLLYVIFFVASILTIVVKKRLSMSYLPIFFVCLEISNVIFAEMNLDEGMNGVYFLVLFTFISYNVRFVFTSITLFYYILIASIFFIMMGSISPDVSLSSNVSRIGNFILVLCVIPVSYVNRVYISREQISNNFILATYIYTAFIVLASIFKFGSNHYDTGLIYGFKYEQWYFGALSVVLLPFYLKYRNKSLDRFLCLLLLVLVLLVLRRTVWLIIFGTGALTVLFLFRKFKVYFKYFLLALVVLVPLALFLSSLSIWDLRGDRSLDSGIESVEEESRFVEFENSIEVLQSGNSMLFGTSFLFDETGRYLHKHSGRSMHGTYSRILFGTGFVGLFIYIFLLIGTVYFLYRYRRKDDLFGVLVLSSFVIYLFVVATGASGIGVGLSYVGSLFLLSGYTIKN